MRHLTFPCDPDDAVTEILDMTETIRTFIAIRISPEFIRTGRDRNGPPSVRDTTLSDLFRELQQFDGLRVVDPAGLHVTLKFLGDTTADLLPRLTETLSGIAMMEPVFDWTVQNIGVFPNARRPSVVWAGIKNGEPAVRIAGQLEQQLQPLGFASESRGFTPHVTLARVQKFVPKELAAWMQSHATQCFGTGRVEHLELLRSDLSFGVPQYTTLARVPLG